MLETRGTITYTADLFQPKYYNAFVDAIYKICGYGEAKGRERATPTTPLQYGPKMRELSDCILAELLMQKIK